MSEVTPERVASAYDGTQLDQLTKPPTDLRDLPASDAAEIIREWFLENFEDPAENTPRDDGDYVYIWGGPYDADEIVREMIEDEATEEQLTAAIALIQRDGFLWVPNTARIQPPEDYDDEAQELPNAEALHAKMLEEIGHVEAQLATLEHPGLGHNHPPEPIDEVPVSENDLKAVAKAFAVLKGQPPEPPEDALPAIQNAEAALLSFAEKLGGYLAKQGDLFVTEAIKAAGKATGVAVGGGIAAAGVVITAQIANLHLHLGHLIHAVGQWLVTVNPPF